MADCAVAETKLLHGRTIKGGARNAVLNTAELLENVLFNLPARQLFTVKRVSRRFKAAVEKSIDIQSKMFLRMQEPDESWGVLGDPPLSVVLIPQRPGQIFGCANSTMKVVKANGAFFKDPRQSADEMARHYGPRLDLHAGMKWSIDAFLKGKSQPWEDVHITDPPSTTVQLDMCQIDLGLRHRFNVCAKVDNPSGVTLGGLLRESFAQKRPLFFYSDGDAVDLRGRSVREFLEDSERTVDLKPASIVC
ncbi:hypothetical protein M409DRAFT_22606 [Zasmidium cellare ATCC 36951]|uniref:F-box domain-containing protein n=1 Tax=Zasmidium cellare ATCC 36951 TaxID=1080233 RepID=A0A6A6CIW4_ZASCE|nr:uncharacterized protein M409DRAFT_22606 [Zasmidium cellare ATCC 36951]KAF2167177.1 hypothetical protein M409DRAFT_22606 [Zasmidium cellare ATCC 36951]